MTKLKKQFLRHFSSSMNDKKDKSKVAVWKTQCTAPQRKNIQFWNNRWWKKKSVASSVMNKKLLYKKLNFFILIDWQWWIWKCIRPIRHLERRTKLFLLHYPLFSLVCSSHSSSSPHLFDQKSRKYRNKKIKFFFFHHQSKKKNKKIENHQYLKSHVRSIFVLIGKMKKGKNWKRRRKRKFSSFMLSFLCCFCLSFNFLFAVFFCHFHHSHQYETWHQK